MRLTQPLKWWQLTLFVVTSLAPTIATAGFHDQPDVRRQPLESEDFPRDVVVVGEIPDTISLAELEDAVQAAAAEWSSVGCSTAELRYRGHVDEVPEFTDATALRFVDPEEDFCFLGDDDIAWTLQGRCCSTGDARELDRSDCSGDIYPPQTVLLNARTYEWRSAPDPYGPSANDERPFVDARSAITHELGHVLDLRHVEGDALATMAPRYLRDGGLATLAAIDRIALCERWPSDGTDCSTDSDCNAFGACMDAGEFSVCEEERAAIGDYCDLAHLTCDERCHLSSPQTYSGYCTSACEVDDDCPGDMFCESDSGECRLRAVPIEPSGCSTTSAAPTTAGLFLMFLALATSRRRRR